MKVYKGQFKKQNGQIREMLFARIEDLPESFLDQKIVGSGAQKQYAPNMELVWDIEADNFRVFNWSTVQGSVKEVAIDSSYFN
jgi:hypothetical protein